VPIALPSGPASANTPDRTTTCGSFRRRHLAVRDRTRSRTGEEWR
jgi:hypothetical protein